MAFTPVPHAEALRLLQEFTDKGSELERAALPNDRQRLAREQAEVAEELGDRLTDDMVAVRGLLATHERNVANWLAAGQRLQKETTTLAERYKKNPTKYPEFVGQVKRNLTVQQGLLREVDDDVTSFGQAWEEFRKLTVSNVPAEHTRVFYAHRQTVMAAGKAILVKRHKLAAVLRETNALKSIVKKATLKKDIKAGNAPERKLTEASAIAAKLELELAGLLDELQNPPDLKPSSLKNTAKIAELNAEDEAGVKNESDLRTLRGSLATAQATVKTMNTRLAAMTKVYETRKKGFRSDELKIPMVQRPLERAAAHLATGKADLKTAAGYLKRIEKAIAQSERNYKAYQKRR